MSNRIGVIVGQLGTPDAPTARALRPYLAQFLSDMRVIDYHPLIWQPLLRGLLLNRRPQRSARLYRRIWMAEGSPLLVYTQRQAEKLQALLGDQFHVVIGMTYGNPSMRAAVQVLEAEGIDRMVVLPMFPQFSSTTTSSVYDAVYRAAAGRRCPFFFEAKRFTPSLRFVPAYYEDAAYIAAMRDHLTAYVREMVDAPDHYVITFHGIPARYVRTGDPYQHQCEVTARLLAQAMGWRDDEWTLCFQSRFGPERWLEPYTDETIEGLHARGIHRPLVFSPGFVTDCLETLDELGNEGREAFEEGGGHGEHYTLAPCLNDDDRFMELLAAIVQREAYGWTPMPQQAAYARS